MSSNLIPGVAGGAVKESRRSCNDKLAGKPETSGSIPVIGSFGELA